VGNHTRFNGLAKLNGVGLGVVPAGTDLTFTAEVRTASSSSSGYGSSRAMYAYVTVTMENQVTRKLSMPKQFTLYNDRVNRIDFYDYDFP
jgi:hypothetical protein